MTNPNEVTYVARDANGEKKVVESKPKTNKPKQESEKPKIIKQPR